MSKCHYIYDKQAGKVLIPCCWAVVLSNDIRDCTCRNEDLTFTQFERERYNKELERSLLKLLRTKHTIRLRGWLIILPMKTLLYE